MNAEGGGDTTIARAELLVLLGGGTRVVTAMHNGPRPRFLVVTVT